MKITIIQGDITALEVDAIVNAANSRGLLGGGVAGAIKRRGGIIIEEETRRKAPTPVGTAISTTAGALSCTAVIHAPTMQEPGSPSTPSNIRAATMAALMLARDLGFRRIAIPGMGTGVGGVNHEQAAEAIVQALRSFAPEHFDEILFADIDPRMIEAFRHANERAPKLNAP